MREVTSALMVGAIWIAVPEVAAAQAKISGVGEHKDRKGIHGRANFTLPSLVRLPEATLHCYDMASRDGERILIAESGKGYVSVSVVEEAPGRLIYSAWNKQKCALQLWQVTVERIAPADK